jgi:HEAT repeat protein
LAKSLESDARTLAADVLAVRMVVAHVLGRIYQLDPILAEAIQGGFEDAVDQVRKTATKSRKRLTSHQAVEALAAVETLRAAMSNMSDNRARPSVANDNK